MSEERLRARAQNRFRQRHTHSAAKTRREYDGRSIGISDGHMYKYTNRAIRFKFRFALAYDDSI